MEYVLRTKYEADISKIKMEIENLKEHKADRKVLQGIKQDIAVLTEQINNMQSDRQEDKEVIADLRDEIKNISKLVNNSTLTSVEIRSNQKHTDEKLTDVQGQITTINASISNIKESIDNSFFNILYKLYVQYRGVKVVTWFIIVILLITLFSAFMFYVQNGIPWNSIKDTFNMLK